MKLQGKGYDLRRLPADTLRAVRARAISLELADSLSPVLPPRRARFPGDSSHRPALASGVTERPYGVGPTRVRYLPASTTGFGGTTSQLAIVRSDPVGRLGIALLGSAGSAALPEGGALTVTSRRFRTELTLSGWLSHEAPSRQLAAADVMDLLRRLLGGGVPAHQLGVDRDATGVARQGAVGRRLGQAFVLGEGTQLAQRRVDMLRNRLPRLAAQGVLFGHRDGATEALEGCIEGRGKDVGGQLLSGKSPSVSSRPILRI